jgi:hypothetical protein
LISDLKHSFVVYDAVVINASATRESEFMRAETARRENAIQKLRINVDKALEALEQAYYCGSAQPSRS